MRYALALSLFLVACSGSAQKVDSGLVGTWELTVPNAQGVARWVWEIHGDGSYAFHAEGPGDVPAHSGTFEAKNGRYTLRSTTMAWADTGTYRLAPANTLTATGKLGTGAWHRVELGQNQPGSDATAASVAKEPADTREPTSAASAGKFPPALIYSYFSHETFDDRALEAPQKLRRTETVDLDEQEKKDGMVGHVRAVVTGASSPGQISFDIYRDRAAAKEAFAANAVFDSKSYRSPPGEMVSSHAYSYHKRGVARCLWRVMVDSGSDASITCYLLVQHPTREPVIIVAEGSQKRIGKSMDASLAAIQGVDALLLAGIKDWEINFPYIGEAKAK